jgi:hypothetical protein
MLFGDLVEECCESVGAEVEIQSRVGADVRRSRSTSVPTGWCYAINATFQVDGGVDSNNSPLPMPDYRSAAP